MNNRRIILIIVCATLLLGLLFSRIFSEKNPMAITSGSAIALMLSSAGLYLFAISMLLKKKH
jgi:hypothetical protein